MVSWMKCLYNRMVATAIGLELLLVGSQMPPVGEQSLSVGGSWAIGGRPSFQSPKVSLHYIQVVKRFTFCNLWTCMTPR